MRTKRRAHLLAATAAALIFIGIWILWMRRTGTDQVVYAQNRSQLNHELSTALHKLGSGNEADYREALAHLYGAYILIDASPYFPEDIKERSTLFDLWDCGTRFPEAFQGHLSEVLSLKDAVRALGAGPEKESHNRLRAVFDQADMALYSITADIPEWG